jgi:hypothetical protein
MADELAIRLSRCAFGEGSQHQKDGEKVISLALPMRCRLENNDCHFERLARCELGEHDTLARVRAAEHARTLIQGA